MMKRAKELTGGLFHLLAVGSDGDGADERADSTVAQSGACVGRSRRLVETADGWGILEHNADRLFKPASTLKLATALVALDVYGPRHRFETVVWTDDHLNVRRGTLSGDLIISGRDPSFCYEHAMILAHELSRLGVHEVTGDLVVAPKFTMNFDPSSARSGRKLHQNARAPLRRHKPGMKRALRPLIRRKRQRCRASS